MSNDVFPPSNLPTSAQLPTPSNIQEAELRSYAERIYNALNAYTSDVARVVHILSQHRIAAADLADRPNAVGSGVFFLDTTANKLYFDSPIPTVAGPPPEYAWVEFAFNADTINDKPVIAPAPNPGEILEWDGSAYTPSTGGTNLDANAVAIQDIPVEAIVPDDGSALIFDLTANEWQPTNIAPLLQTDAISIHGTDVADLPLSNGMGLIYNLSNDEWEPTLSAPLLDTNAISIQGDDVDASAPATGAIHVFDTDTWYPSNVGAEYGILPGLITDQINIDRSNQDVRLVRTAVNWLEIQTATASLWANVVAGGQLQLRSNSQYYPQFKILGYHDSNAQLYNLFYRSRGSYASPADVQSGDGLGMYGWYGRLSSIDKWLGYILANVAGTPSGGLAPSKISFGVADGVATNPGEILRLDGSGMPTAILYEQLRLSGSGIVWDDVKVDINAIKVTGANQPTWTKVTDDGSGSAGVYAWAFDVGDEAWFEMQIPHRFKEGSDINLHLHWCPTTYTATAKKAKFGIEFIWRNISGFFGAATTTHEAEDTIPAATSKTHYITAFNASGQSGWGQNVSSVLLARVYRTAASADEYPNSIYFLSIDAHIQIDAMGSDQETSKT